MDSFILDSFKNLEIGMHDVAAWGEAEVHDTFEAYLKESVKAVFAKENTNWAQISGRLTSILQPLELLE